VLLAVASVAAVSVYLPARKGTNNRSNAAFGSGSV
jgi:hypothetical protein